VSLRILFADDSVTAQNMGKKILTEAGYEVVAVSNGAAAVKKIAEQKPDIIILDVYMPGYSGLEVCEKVRSSIATIKTPVLLTVGKMEPYKPEDANRVRADGVIIKPFEASDLLAIVKKFEERIGQAPVAVASQPAVAQQPAEEIAVQAAETNHEPPARVVQAMVEVPDHMATSSAFSDLLGTDATRMEHFHIPPIPESVAPSAEAEPPAHVPNPEYDLPVAWKPQTEPEPAVAESANAATEVPARPIQIPVYQEPEPSQFEVVPTAAAPTGDIEIARESGLQESAEEATRNTIADMREPDLVPTAHHIAAPEHAPAAETSAQAVEAPIAVVEEVAAETSPVASSEAADFVADATASLSEADFEARVAAAMAAYGQPAETAQVAMPPDETRATHAEEPAAPAIEEPVAEVTQSESLPVEQPAVAAETNVSPIPVSVAAPETAPEMPEKAVAQAAAAGADHNTIVARVEAELPGAAHAVAEAAAATESEHATIAQAVHRVMERMKDNLVEEIVRELKKK